MTVYDGTPTLLAWLSLPIGDDMDGDVAPFLTGPAPRRVATHDTGPIRRAASDDSGAEETLLEELRTLGYIE